MSSAVDTIVLVTGASGYLGSHVVKALLARGYSVRGTVRSTSNKAKIGHLQKLIDAGEHLDLVEADLLREDSWPTAVSGCTYVCHVASPFPTGDEDGDLLVKTAVEGTRNVLKSSKADPGVKKAVLVSSIVAIIAGWEGRCRGNIEEPEKRWSNPKKCDPYSKSKTLAEKSAWDLIENSEMTGSLELAVVNPGFILGPTLSTNVGTSVDVCVQILSRAIPMTPHMCMATVDVRDVSEGIVRAMEKPEANGERIAFTGGSIWFNVLAQSCREVFAPLGYNPPYYNMPNFLVHSLAWFVPSMRSVSRSLGDFYELDNSKAREVLGMDFISSKESFVAMCHSVIEHGLVPKTPKYEAWEMQQEQQES